MELRRASVAGGDVVVERLGGLLHLEAEGVGVVVVGEHLAELPGAGLATTIEGGTGRNLAFDTGLDGDRRALCDPRVLRVNAVNDNARFRVRVDVAERQQDTLQAVGEVR